MVRDMLDIFGLELIDFHGNMARALFVVSEFNVIFPDEEEFSGRL